MIFKTLTLAWSLEVDPNSVGLAFKVLSIKKFLVDPLMVDLPLISMASYYPTSNKLSDFLLAQSSFNSSLPR